MAMRSSFVVRSVFIVASLRVDVGSLTPAHFPRKKKATPPLKYPLLDRFTSSGDAAGYKGRTAASASSAVRPAKGGAGPRQIPVKAAVGIQAYQPAGTYLAWTKAWDHQSWGIGVGVP